MIDRRVFGRGCAARARRRCAGPAAAERAKGLLAAAAPPPVEFDCGAGGGGVPTAAVAEMAAASRETPRAGAMPEPRHCGCVRRAGRVREHCAGGSGAAPASSPMRLLLGCMSTEREKERERERERKRERKREGGKERDRRLLLGCMSLAPAGAAPAAGPAA